MQKKVYFFITDLHCSIFVIYLDKPFLCYFQVRNCHGPYYNKEFRKIWCQGSVNDAYNLTIDPIILNCVTYLKLILSFVNGFITWSVVTPFQGINWLGHQYYGWTTLFKILKTNKFLNLLSTIKLRYIKQIRGS